MTTCHKCGCELDDMIGYCTGCMASWEDATKPNPQEQALLLYLLAVLKASEHSKIVLGVPEKPLDESR